MRGILAAALTSLVLVAFSFVPTASADASVCDGVYQENEQNPDSYTCQGVWIENGEIVCVGYYQHHADGTERCNYQRIE